MNETIYDLIDAIKEDKRYLQFKEQSLKLLNQETKELLDNYQNLLQELDDLKKFEKYIDLSFEQLASELGISTHLVMLKFNNLSNDKKKELEEIYINNYSLFNSI